MYGYSWKQTVGIGRRGLIYVHACPSRRRHSCRHSHTCRHSYTCKPIQETDTVMHTDADNEASFRCTSGNAYEVSFHKSSQASFFFNGQLLKIIAQLGSGVSWISCALLWSQLDQQRTALVPAGSAVHWLV